uniref:Uncharacterized protein n=1 Tax=Arundo donax TaxID=35708 RepID=A0A0A8ZH46_ARUDO
MAPSLSNRRADPAFPPPCSGMGQGR